MDTNRRNFLGGAGIALTSLLLGSCAKNSETAPNSLTSQKGPLGSSSKPAGQLLAFGTDGHLYPGYSGKHRNQVSVLTAVDMGSGKMIQTPLPMGAGHSALAVGDGRIVCVAHHKGKSIVVDGNHKELATLRSPNDYVYGGHGLVLPDRGVFVLCMRYEDPKTVDDHGQYEIYDLKTLKLLDRIDSGGLHPHEIHIIPGTDELIATHYGDIFVRKPPYTHNTVETKLTVYDAKTMKVKRHYLQPEFGAMVTHMNVTKDKDAYFVMTQYIEGSSKRRAKKSANGGSIESVAEAHDNALIQADMELEKVLGHKREFAIPYEAAQELKIPLPLPFVRVNTQTGERKVMLTSEANQLRSQSVGYNEMTNTAIGIYYHSDTAILHQPGKDQAEVLNAADIGIAELRGVADIPGTSCVGFVAAHRGMVVYDLAGKQVVARYPYQYFDTVHLSYNPLV